MITVKRESDGESDTWEFAYDARAHKLCFWALTRKRGDDEQLVGPRRPRVIPADVLEDAKRFFIETLNVEDPT